MRPLCSPEVISAGPDVPRFSVVVPTRDRPDLLDFCLAGIAAQTFEDVEVIVSDNPTERPARAVFDRWKRAGWQYLRPDEELAMHENFERACAAATGEYVAVVIDKTVLQPSALTVADAALAAEPEADIVSWRNEGYNPVDEGRRLGRGRFRPTGEAVAPTTYEPRAELRTRFENATRRGVDPVHYVRAKIVFGAYSRRLLERIGEWTGRVFHPLAPDYTSMVPACVFAKKALDVGRPLLVSYNSVRSNGRRQGVDPLHARRFIETADPAIIEKLPIPGLYTSSHNVVAYDLVSSAARCPAGTTPALDFGNLLRRAREDLAGVAWVDPAERDAQYAVLEAAERQADISPPLPELPAGRRTREVVAALLARMPPVERLAYRATRRTSPTPPTYDSPVDAARAADRFYGASSG
jgi:hypothetical protein